MDEPRVRDRRPLRQRVSKACDSCRSRKDRCDGRKPVCSSCLKLGRACLYNTQSKKRGLKEGYVRGLEKLWALAIRRIPGFEGQLIVLLQEAIGDESQHNEIVREWFDVDENKSLIRAWKDSSLFQEFDRALEYFETVPEKTTKQENTITSIQTAPLHNITPFKRQSLRNAAPRQESLSSATLDWNSPSSPIADSPLRLKDNGPVPVIEGSKPLEDPLENHSKRIKAPKLPATAWQLLELYFSFTHCWFPILEKHDVVKTLYESESARSQIAQDPKSSSAQALLWALLTYSKAQYSTLEKNSLGSVDFVVEKPDTDIMFEHSRSMIPLDPEELNIFHLQALLLLALTSMQSGGWKKAWIVIGHAARAISCIDTQSDSSHVDDLSPLRASRGSHVFYGCFILDTIISARLGRQSQLRECDIDLVQAIDESGLEEWEPWKGNHGVPLIEASVLRGPCAGPSTYNRLTTVIRYLNRSSNSAVSLDSQTVFEDLRAWASTQPFFSHMDLSVQGKAHVKYPLLPHQIHLRFSYIATMLHLYMKAQSSPVMAHLNYILALIGQGCRLLEKHAIFFGYGNLPPTYDYYALVICETLEFIDKQGLSLSRIRGDLREMKDSTYDISILWPAFENTKDRFHAIFESFTLPRDNSADTDTQNQPAQVESTHEGQTSLAYRHNSLFETSIPVGYGDDSDKASLISSAAMTFSQASPIAQQQVDDKPLNAVIDTTDTSSIADPGTAAASDVDSILQDFGTMDAMEWMDDWQDSLTHLGFAAGAGNEEFHNFWLNMQAN